MLNKLKSLFSNNAFQALIIFVVFFGLYLSKSTSSIVGYGWSDDFVRSGLTGSYLKAPQFFILQSIIGFVSYLLPKIPGEILGYGLAGFLGAGTLSFLYLIYSEIEKNRSFMSNTHVTSKIVSILLLGISYYFFIQSIVIERYILVVFLLSLLIYLSIVKKKGSNPFIGFLFTIFLTVGVLYHWIFLYYLIFKFLYGFKNKKFKNGWLKYLMIGLLFAYITLSLNINEYSPNVSYTYIRDNSIKSLFNLYKETYFFDGFDANISFSVNDIRSYVFNLVGAYIQSVGYVYVAIMLFGLLIVIGKNKISKLKKYLIMLAGLLFLMIYFSGYYPVSKNLEIYLLSIIVLLVATNVLLWVGIEELLDRFFKASKVLNSKYFMQIAGGLLIIILAYYPVIKSINVGFDEYDSELFAKDVLEKLDNNSYLICFDDNVCSTLIYENKIKKIREDVIVIPYWYHPEKYYLNLSDVRPFEYSNYPDILHEIVAEILSNEDKSIYSVGISNYYWKYFGFNRGFVHYVPMGYFGKIEITTPENLPSPTFPHLSFNSKSSVRDPLKSRLVLSMIQNRVMNGMIYFMSGLSERGYNEISEASKIANWLHPKDFNDFLNAKTYAERKTENKYFKNSHILEPVDVIVDDANNFLDNDLSGSAIELIRGAILMKPHDVDIRLEAANIYKEAGLISNAIKEYENVLVLDENNLEATNSLKSINE